MRLYLIRHAQSYNNALPDQRQRVAEPPLTALGEQQAEHLARYLASTAEFQDEPYTFSQVYCSPMLRTLQTAQPLAAALNLLPQVWVDLHEAGGIFLEDEEGQATGFPGLRRSEIVARFPGFAPGEQVSEEGWWDPARGRETYGDFLARALRVWMSLRERIDAPERILLVAHGGFIDALMKAILNQLPTAPRSLFYIHNNTGVTRFDFQEGLERVQLLYSNRLEHLPPSLRTH